MAETEFTALCQRCDACQQACPSGVIQRGATGFPELNFQNGACDFCGRCAPACTHGALHAQGPSLGLSPWPYRVQVLESCLLQQRVECRSCGDACPEAALRFRPQLGGGSTLRLDLERCTGCGACIAPCPSHALQVFVPDDGVVPAATAA